MIYKVSRKMWKKNIRGNADVGKLERYRGDLVFKRARKEEEISNLDWLVERIDNQIASVENGTECEQNPDEFVVPFVFDGKVHREEDDYYFYPSDGEDATSLRELMEEMDDHWVRVVVM